MKTNKYLTALLSLLLLAATAISLASCNKDDDPKESDINNVNPDNPSAQNIDSLVSYYDDLAYFQSVFVLTDKAGNFRCRSMGVPLYESDTAHLYIGVDNLDEALRYFEGALAPDIAKQTSVSNNYIYTFTDTLGNSQGTVSFVPGSGASLAEITTDLPDLKYFNKVTFLPKSAWPHNSARTTAWHKGDIRTFSLVGDVYNYFEDDDRTLNWVLVREEGYGLWPLWCAITRNKYWRTVLGLNLGDPTSEMKSIIDAGYCLSSYYAQWICADWDFFVQKFDEAGCGALDTSYVYWDASYWYGKGFRYWYDFYAFGEKTESENTKYCVYKGYNGYGDKYFILSISWVYDNGPSFYTLTADPNREWDNPVSNIFDNDVNTKMCCKYDCKVKSEVSGEKCWLFEFKTAEPINPTAYYMVTGNDQSVFPGRNPKKWNIYAKKNPGDVWVLIDKRDNTDIQIERMAAENFWTGWWGVNVGKAKYQYFRFEMYENWGDDCFQISEFGFQYNENIGDDELYYSVLDASYGYLGNLAPNLFDGNFDTKWCVDEDNKSKTPLHDGKCWYVEFMASKPITPAGFCMTTANDHTTFPDRAPRKWNLYGLKDGWWTLIASYDNTETPVYQMTYADKWTGYWGINVAKGEYQYFRLEMYENWGADCFQISEFGFYF